LILQHYLMRNNSIKRDTKGIISLEFKKIDFHKYSSIKNSSKHKTTTV
jgi:hypothetical protein